MLLILGVTLNAFAFGLVVMTLVAASNRHTENAEIVALLAIATAIIGSGLICG